MSLYKMINTKLCYNSEILLSYEVYDKTLKSIGLWNYTYCNENKTKYYH